MKTAERRARRLVSRTDLARMGGVSQPAITKLCKGKLAPALVGDRIDIDAPCVQAWLASKGWTDPAPTGGRKKAAKAAAAPTKSPKNAPAAPAEPTAPAPPPVDERRSELDSLQLEVTRERLRERQLKNEMAEGRSIGREEVSTHVFGAFAMLFKRLLEDVPHTLVSRLFAAARSGESLEGGKAVFVEVIQAQLESLKKTITEALRDP